MGWNWEFDHIGFLIYFWAIACTPVIDLESLDDEIQVAFYAILAFCCLLMAVASCTICWAAINVFRRQQYFSWYFKTHFTG